ncbi:MAG: alcohol dehydrogenase catalytic domain-containing protein [Flavobacteriales bacterium]|nr:alcohol dehydrogenase catalytic domain-containing protein [Flavobacteriales bacterium]
MKALVRTKPGKDFSSMKVDEVNLKSLGESIVRVKMASSRINPVDMDLMKGFPGLKYPDNQIGGVDGAGEVLEVGSAVSRFRKGDKIFFYRPFNDVGSWGEAIDLPENYAAHIPQGISLQQAGSIALQ